MPAPEAQPADAPEAVAPPDPPPAPERPDPAAELAILLPDLDVVVRDPDGGGTVTLTVREPTFRAALDLAVEARPLVEALADAGGPGAAPEATEAALAAHADLWIAIVARATGRDSGWISRLGSADADAVCDALWRTHADFFVRRILAAEMRHRSPPSSTRSSPADTGAAPTT